MQKIVKMVKTSLQKIVIFSNPFLFSVTDHLTIRQLNIWLNN